MIPSQSIKNKFLLVAVLAFGGCSFIPAVGPNYEEPKVNLPPEWVSLDKRNSARTAAKPTTAEGIPSVAPSADVELKTWWTNYNEPQLTVLVEKALEKNHDLKIAADRVLRAKALRMQAVSDFLPSIDAIGSYSRSDSSRSTGTIRPDDRTVVVGPRSSYNVGLSSSWEIDIFGRVRRSVEAANADIDAQEEEYHGVLLSLLAEVATSYIGLRASQKRVTIAEHNIKIQEQNSDLVEARFSAGISSELDVAQAKAELESTRAQVPLLEQAVKNGIYRLSVLTGENPGDGLDLSKVPPPAVNELIIASTPEILNVGVPSDLLRRRPDVRSAERQLAAATARIGAAMAEFFPSFDITAAFGGQSQIRNNVFGRNSEYWSIVPGLRLPIFQGGRILAGVRANRAFAHEALMQYEKTVLTALEETENAFVSLSKQRDRNAALSRAFAATQRALELSTQLYEQGLADFLRVIEAERSAYAAEDRLVQSEQDLATSTVRIYTALGGGW